MLDTYRAAFRAPGTAAFTAAGFVMRMPIAIYPIGLVLILSARTGHYGFAGLLSGTYVVANGVGKPVLGRLVDRYGQHRVADPGVGGTHRRCCPARACLSEPTLRMPSCWPRRTVARVLLPIGRIADSGALVVRAGRSPGAHHGLLARVHAGRGDLHGRTADRHAHRHPDRPGAACWSSAARWWASAPSGFGSSGQPSRRPTRPARRVTPARCAMPACRS